MARQRKGTARDTRYYVVRTSKGVLKTTDERKARRRAHLAGVKLLRIPVSR
jgi:hypothetical protein